MKKFVKGLLFGSIVGGTVALLTTKQNGKKNREQLYENIVSLSEDISTLSNGIPVLQKGTQQLQYRIIPQVKELSEEIMEDVQNFKHMSQPRIKRIQAHLSLLNKHIQEAKKGERMIRLFASDMDGTILQDHSTIHPDNVKMVHYLQEQNIPFVICSGRDFYQASLCLEPANLQCPVIGLNGAVIYKEDGTILKEITLSHEDTRKLIQVIEKYHNNWDMMTSKGLFSLHFAEKFAKRVATFKENHPDLSPEQFEAELEKLRKLFDATDVSSLEEVLEDPTIKIYKVLTSNYESKDSLMEITSYVEQELPNLVVTSSFKTNIEVTHKDAQKGIALQFYADTLGISMDEVFAIGDNSNDVSMLKLAGYSVAMGNANQEAMQTATYQTDDNKHGGVAKAIQKCLDQQS